MPTSVVLSLRVAGAGAGTATGLAADAIDWVGASPGDGAHLNKHTVWSVTLLASELVHMEPSHLCTTVLQITNLC